LDYFVHMKCMSKQRVEEPPKNSYIRECMRRGRSGGSPSEKNDNKLKRKKKEKEKEKKASKKE